jgi:aspartate kinase
VADRSAKEEVLVVASALAGVTNRLEDLVRKASDNAACWSEIDAIEELHLEVLESNSAPCESTAGRAVRAVARGLRADLDALAAIGSPSLEIGDRILAAGERMSVQLVAAAVRSVGIQAEAVDAADLVATDRTFGEARVNMEATRDRCRDWIKGQAAAVPVVTGFIGSDDRRRTTTLGRGGSDLSAAVLGVALDADRVEIWTDVDGVLTAPPRLVPSVSSIPWLSYEEAAELSFYGAKVLHPKTVQPLAEHGIPIRVRNSLQPTRRGTEINSGRETTSRVVAVSSVDEVTVLRVKGWMPRRRHRALMCSQASSDGATLVAVPTNLAEAVIGDLVANEAGVLDDCFPAAFVAVVGHDIGLQPWVAGRALEALARRNIAVRSFAAGAGLHTVALLVDRMDLEAALTTVHDALMLDRELAVPSVRRKLKEVDHVTAA